MTDKDDKVEETLKRHDDKQEQYWEIASSKVHVKREEVGQDECQNIYQGLIEDNLGIILTLGDIRNHNRRGVARPIKGDSNFWVSWVIP